MKEEKREKKDDSYDRTNCIGNGIGTGTRIAIGEDDPPGMTIERNKVDIASLVLPGTKD